MKISEDSSFKPITVVIESEREAEMLHKILASVIDETEEQDAPTELFYALGRQLDATDPKFGAKGEIHLEDR